MNDTSANIIDPLVDKTLRLDVPYTLPGSEHLHILVVDDVATTRKILQRMLTRLGHSVSLAINGEDALSQMRGTRFDLVVMDIQMPIMNGLDASLETTKFR